MPRLPSDCAAHAKEAEKRMHNDSKRDDVFDFLISIPRGSGPLLLMFRVSAARELFQVLVAFIMQLLVYAYLRSVVAINSGILDGAEEFLFGGRGRLFILADLFQQFDLLVNGP